MANNRRRSGNPAKRAKNNEISYTELAASVEQPDDLRIEVAPDVWLTFHDPYDGSYEEELDLPEAPREQLQYLLGDEEFEKFEATGTVLSGRFYVALVNRVMEHFRLGEGSGS